MHISAFHQQQVSMNHISKNNCCQLALSSGSKTSRWLLKGKLYWKLQRSGETFAPAVQTALWIDGEDFVQVTGHGMGGCLCTKFQNQPRSQEHKISCVPPTLCCYKTQMHFRQIRGLHNKTVFLISWKFNEQQNFAMLTFNSPKLVSVIELENRTSHLRILFCVVHLVQVFLLTLTV